MLSADSLALFQNPLKMTENKDPLLLHQMPQWKRGSDKQAMENDTSEPFDYKEALWLLQRAVNPMELDIQVIMEKLKLDEKAIQELTEYMNRIPDDTKCLPGLQTAFFLYHKLVSSDMYHDKNTIGVFFKILVEILTSSTIVRTTGKLPCHNDVACDDTSPPPS